MPVGVVLLLESSRRVKRRLISKLQKILTQSEALKDGFAREWGMNHFVKHRNPTKTSILNRRLTRDSLGRLIVHCEDKVLHEGLIRSIKLKMSSAA